MNQNTTSIPLGDFQTPRGPQIWTSSSESTITTPEARNPAMVLRISQESDDLGQWPADYTKSAVEPPTPNTYQRYHDSTPVHGNPFVDPSYSPFSPSPYNQVPQRQDDDIRLLQDQKHSPKRGSFHPQTRDGPPAPSHDFGTPPSGRRLIRPSKWRWRVSWNMYLFLLFGVACAVGHHIFYTALDGKPATDQVRMLRYGTLLAVASKAGLSAAVVVAFRQVLWTTVRTRLMSIAALDSLFAATDDLVALVNWELIKNAKVAVLLAGFVWLSSLVIILTSNTLLVEPRMIITDTTCPGVRTLNFTFEETADWRNPQRIDQLFEMPVSLWNTTKPENEEPAGWFDYYTAPAPGFQRAATIGAYLEQAMARKNAQLETCGSGWNCTFIINFTAPAYKCTELASGVGSKPVNLTQESGSIAPPFDTDILLPMGAHSYYAFATGGEYSSTQMKDSDIGGIPKSKPPYPKTMGAFRTEPVVWVGYSKIADPSKPVPLNPSDPSWSTAFIPTLFACENYESSYTVNVSYNDAIQTTSITSLRHLRPVINTTYLAHLNSNDGTADNITATPKSNYIYPQDVALYRRTAAYHSLGYMLRAFINGTIALDTAASLVNPLANTAAIQTKLIDPRNNFFPHPDLPQRIQSFYQDIILSMLGTPQFVSVVWASDPSTQTGAQTVLPPDGKSFNPDKASEEEREMYKLYPCRKSRTANVYAYSVRDLWIVYSIACVLAVGGVVAGAVAMREGAGGGEGAVRDTRFSSIVAATRGPALEKVRWESNSSGAGMGGTGTGTFWGGDGNLKGEEDGDGDGESVMRVSENVKRLRVGYGLLRRGSGRGRGFGRKSTGGSIGGGSKMGSREGDGGLDGGYGGAGMEGVGDAAASSDVALDRGYYYGFGLEGDVEQIPRKRTRTRARAGSI